MPDVSVLDEAIEMAEAEIPANPNAPRNLRLERSYARLMSNYFKGLEQAFPYDRLDSIYYKNVTMESFRESAVEDADEILDALLRVFNARLLTSLNGEHINIYLTGSAEMITWGTTKAGIPIAYEGPPIRHAIDYAREHCAQLVTNLNDETKKRLAQVISKGIENKRGIDGLARDIRKEFTDMSRYRSQLIAKNETADALGQAFEDRGKELGLTGKEWVTVGDDRVSEGCQENEAAGIIPFNQPFPSGHMRPPRFPGCRCAAAPAMLKE